MLDTHAIIEKYYPEGESRVMMFSHASDVKDMALEIIDKHPELNADREFIAEAAMLHDIAVYLVDAPGIACYGDYPYLCHGYLGRELLEKEGLPKHALVCERHIGVGITRREIRRNKLPLPKRTMKPKSIEEKVVCFADLFYSKSKLGKRFSVEQVRDKLLRHGLSKAEKFDKWCDLFL